MNRNEFFDFLNGCYEELEEKQSMLQDQYHLNDYSDVEVDYEGGLLILKNDALPTLIFTVIPIGTYQINTKNWVWAWADEGVSAELRQKASDLRALTNITGAPQFDEEVLELDEQESNDLVAMAVRYLSAIGAYLHPGTSQKTYLALFEKES